MGKIIEGLKSAAMTLLDPRYVAKQTEAAHLRQLYNNDSAVVPRCDQWYKVVSQRGDLVGVAYSCACRVEYQLLSMNDYFKEYDCPACGNHFSLLKAVGYDASKHTPANLPALMVDLPVRPRLSGTKQSPFLDTWSESGGGASGEVGYEMSDYKGV